MSQTDPTQTINLPPGFSIVQEGQQQPGQQATINLPPGFTIVPQEPTPERRVVPGSATFATRALASLPITAEGEVNLLKQRLGEENVFTDPQGNIFVREEGRDAFVRLDPAGFDIGDITADAPGTVIDALGGIIGGVAGAATPATPIGGAAIGAGIARTARQGLAEALGADEPLTFGERARDVATSATLEAAGGAAGEVLTAGIRGLKNRAFGSILGARASNPVVDQRAAIEEFTGIPFRRGERAGSTSLLTLEGEIARNPATADIVQAADELRLTQSRDFIDDRIRRLGAEGVSVPSAAQEIATAFDTGVKRAARLRSVQGRQDFGAVDRLSGNLEIIGAPTLERTLREELQQANLPKFFTETGEIKERNLQKMLQSVSDGKNLTAGETQAILQKISSVQRGTDSFFKDLPQRSQIALASRLRSALETDLDDAIEAGGLTGDVAEALRTARTRWRSNTQAINDFGDLTISKVLDVPSPDPDTVGRRLLNLSPTEIKRTKDIIDPVSPGVFEKAGGAIIDDFLNQAAETAPTTALTTTGQQGISFSKFSTLWNKNKNKLQQILPEDIFKDINTISEQFRIFGDKAGTLGSPTQPLQEAGRLLDALSTKGAGGLKEIAAGIPSQLLQMMSRREVARILLGGDVPRASLVEALTSGSPSAVLRNFGILNAALLREQSRN